MGCDIHIWAEFKVPGQLQWKRVRAGRTKCKYCGGNGFNATPERPPKECWDCGGKKVREPDFFEGRNYDAFAILADVRNGHGFAGIKTGGGFVPIADPRGVPDDASSFYLKQVEKWDGDGHSHTYVTLAELQAYDWEQVTTHDGVVGPSIYADWVKNGKKGAPRSYSGGVHGAGITHVSNEEMERLIASGEVTVTPLKPGSWRDPDWMAGGAKQYFTQVEWTETYRESAGELVTHTIPLLEQIAKRKKLNPEDIRIVMFFDN